MSTEVKTNDTRDETKKVVVHHHTLSEDIMEIIGFCLALFDQVSDIYVIYSDQFDNADLYWAAVGVMIANIFIITRACLYRVIKAKYWKPALMVNQRKITPYMQARIIEYFLLIFGYFFHYLLYAISFLVAKALTLFVVWFGLNKLSPVSRTVESFMSMLLVEGQLEYQALNSNKLSSKISPQENQAENKIEIGQPNILEIKSIEQVQQNGQQIQYEKKKEEFDLEAQEIEKILQSIEDDSKSNENEVGEIKNAQSLKQIQYESKNKELNVKIDEEKEVQQSNNKEQGCNNQEQNDIEKQPTEKLEDGKIENELFYSSISKEEAIRQNLSDFQFNQELLEKIFENIPQLIIQIINQTLGGGSNSGITILSIVLALLNIGFNIFSAIKMKNKKLQEQYRQALQNIKMFLMSISILKIMHIIQIAIYIIVTSSYKWNDYLYFKSTTYGKDVDDSIRSFIIVFPIFVMVTMYQFSSFRLQDKKKSIQDPLIEVICMMIKNATLIQVIIDILAYEPAHLQYGQQLFGQTGVQVMCAVGLFSTIVEILFINQYLSSELSLEEYLYIGFILAVIIAILKQFAYFINFAHYYDWTSFSEKQKDASPKVCDENLENTLQAYLIIFVFRYLLAWISIEKKDYSFLWALLKLMYLVVDSLLLNFIIKSSFCDNLVYVQKHYYILIISVFESAVSFVLSLYLAFIMFEES